MTHREEVTMSRIPVTARQTTFTRFAAWYSRRKYGAVLDPLDVMAHNPRVLRADAFFEGSVAKWDRLDPQLKLLAVLTSSATIGCSWCMDFGYWVAHSEGVPEAKLREIPRWRDSDAYTDVERLVMTYADAMSRTPMEVDDAVVAALREHLDDAALVELTMMVAVENQRSRFNSALGLTGQGFKDRCELGAGAKA
jgi:alkylhydroperoxidase family enzyme